MEVNPILIDTNAYVAFKRGQTRAIEIFQHAPAIAVSTVVLGELLSGFAMGTREKANRKELAEFLASPRVTVLPIDHATAEHYAIVYAGLRKVGTPIPTNDIWIAASALSHRLDLFSHDEHFRTVEGLRVGASLAELQAHD